MLRQVRLDLGDPRARPVFDPGLAQVVLDPVQTALAHTANCRHADRTAPWAVRLICACRRPISSAIVDRFLLVNPRSGDDRPSVDDLVRAARARGIRTHVLVEGDDAGALALATEATAIGIAGGDGSLAAVAAAAVERDVRFVCVPYGTRNHFARDLGLDRADPIAALDAFDGEERRVDVARAGDRIFLNNVSLGMYASLVHRRERHRRSRQAFARMRAWLIVATHREPLGVTVDGDAVETRLLLVANNAYALELPSLGERERLDEGVLHLYLVQGGVDERTGTRFEVDVPGGRIRAAIDGEPEVLQTPIRFTIEPRALRVLVPKSV